MPSTPSAAPVALVTGASRGIGKACALRLAEAGFDLVINDLDTEEHRLAATAVAGLVGSMGRSALLALGDLGDLSVHDRIVRTVYETMGRLDCLVNNAGVPAERRGDLLDVKPESFDRCIRVNARAVFFLTQRVARAMLEHPHSGQGHRSIVFITSSNAKAVSIARGEYCVSKAAASMTTQLFALRLAADGIGVYEVRPGIIETDMTKPVKGMYDQFIENHGVPAGRWGYPEDVASTVTCMAEGRLKYTVGQSVAVDGGLVIPRF